MKKVKRDIKVIASELQIALKRETKDSIDIGSLLIEAKAQLEHGKWLPWLKKNFGGSVSSAQNYMNAARFAAKYPTVGNLKIRPTALYALGAKMDVYSPEVIKSILEDAEVEWINDARLAFEERRHAASERLRVGAARLRGFQDQPRGEAAARSEADDIIDGPPPGVPPPPEPSAPNVTLPPFDAAVETLSQLHTKPLASFTGTMHSPETIKAIAVFLQAVADAVERQKSEKAAA